jgi:hypothetical protein
MKGSVVLQTLVLLSVFISVASSCNGQEAMKPTPTLEPSPILTATPESASPAPEAIDWVSVSAKISQLSADSGVSIYEVKQLTEDIVEIAVEGGCTDFADLLDSEPEFVLLGEPQLDSQGICIMWFRVLPD